METVGRKHSSEHGRERGGGVSFALGTFLKSPEDPAECSSLKGGTAVPLYPL